MAVLAAAELAAIVAQHRLDAGAFGLGRQLVVLVDPDPRPPSLASRDRPDGDGDGPSALSIYTEHHKISSTTPSADGTMLELHPIPSGSIPVVQEFSELIPRNEHHHPPSALAYWHERPNPTVCLSGGLSDDINTHGACQLNGVTSGNNFISPGAASVVLMDCLFFPRSSLFIQRDGGVLFDNFRYVPFWGQTSVVDTNFVRDGNRFFLQGEFSEIEQESRSLEFAISASSIAGMNYGHFLFDGLGLCIMQFEMSAQMEGRRVLYPSLLRWQREILELTGLLGSVTTTDRPLYVRNMMISTLLSGSVQTPSKFCRTVFDRMKFAGGIDETAPRRVYLRRRQGGKRAIRNEQELNELLLKMGFVGVYPEELSVRDQIRQMSNAEYVVGQSGAGMANACFAPLGASVVEIMPEKHPDRWLRNASGSIGFHWSVFTCRVDDDDVSQNPGWNGTPQFQFSVPLELFAGTLELIVARRKAQFR